MTVCGTGGKYFVFGVILTLALPLGAAAASPKRSSPIVRHPAPAHVTSHSAAHVTRTAWHPPSRHVVRHTIGHHSFVRRYTGGGVLQCVTYVNRESAVHLTGNAVDWWYNAAGIYDRGQRPEVDSVLTFRANGRMPLGHVAVVARVVNSRLIEINQAHWPIPGAVGGISLHVPVVDVSPDNDWSEVRVGLGTGTAFGSIYPTYGFIYPRGAAPRIETAAAASAGPVETASAATAPATYSPATYSEVAEAPASAAGIDLRISDAPARAVR
jgi:surface antigen